VIDKDAPDWLFLWDSRRIDSLSYLPMHNGTRRSSFSAPMSRAGLTAFRRQSSQTLTRKSTRQRNRSYFRIVARSVGQFGRRSGLGQPRVMSKRGGGAACGAFGRLVASVSVLNAVLLRV
jgi:hypothetical protein